MFVLLSEGRSWPGGYFQGRFNIQATNLRIANIESFLARGLLVDAGERQAVVSWGSDGPGIHPNAIGINYALVALNSPDLGPNVQKYLAHGVATGKIRPQIMGQLIGVKDIKVVAGEIYSTAIPNLARLRANQPSTVVIT